MHSIYASNSKCKRTVSALQPRKHRRPAIDGSPQLALARVSQASASDLIVAMELYKRRQEHRMMGLPIFYSSACGLAPRSLLHDREEIRFAFRTTAATLELGSLLDRERHVMYVAVNLR